MEDRDRAVRGNGRPADHPRLEGVAGNIELRAGLFGDPAAHLGDERHFLGVPAGGVHPDDPAAAQHVERRAVGGPGVAGEDAFGLHALGEVRLDGVGQQAFAARLQIPEKERRARSEPVALEGDRAAGDPAGEGEPAAVRRGLRGDGAPARSLVLLLGLALGYVVDLAGLQVEFPDLHRPPDQIALGRRGEVEVEAPVRRRGGPAGARVITSDEFDAAPALGVEQVEPGTARLAERETPGHDPLPVRQPGRGGDPRVGVLVDRPRVAAVRIHEPEVRLSAPVGDEGDRRAVGRPARVVVHCHPAVLGQALRLPAGGGHPVNVAEQVEDERVAVRRHVEGHEGALRGLEDEVVGLAPGERGVPTRIVGAAALLGEPGGSHQAQGGKNREASGAERKGRRRGVPHGVSFG